MPPTSEYISMKKYIVPFIVASALIVAIVGSRQKAQAQNIHSQGMDQAGTTMGDAAGSKTNDPEISAVYVTDMPPGYRDWRLISVAHEEGRLNDIRAILGNDAAIKAYRDGALPFPEGAIVARVAWSYVPSEENNKIFVQVLKRDGQRSFVAGPPTNGVQFMIKDSTKYASTGGWGFGQFNDGKPASQALLQSCYPCHQTIKSRDLIFTHYAR